MTQDEEIRNTLAKVITICTVHLPDGFENQLKGMKVKHFLSQKVQNTLELPQ
jgi:hypothetical protein